jgi:hypothetical protein
MKRFVNVALFALLALVAVHGTAQAQCTVGGDITAAMTTDPLLPDWEYTMTVTWDTGTMFGLSHFNLLVDLTGGTCECQEVMDSIMLVNPAGTGDGVTSGPGGGDPCTLDYNANWACDGDPSIPGVEGIIIKFEPDESLGCEPAPAGTVDVVFYSDLPPTPVDEDVLSMSDKAGLIYCFGTVTGVFPGLACDPVPNDTESWGGLKGLYR